VSARAEDIITELLAIRARVDEAIGKLRAMPQSEPREPVVEAKYQKLAEFCERWNISRTTLHTRIGEGLPSVGSGRDRRIVVKDGDAWMERRTGLRPA
jgi:hypothetical protein